MDNRVLDPNSLEADADVEATLNSVRPKTFKDIIGRKSEKQNLQVIITAAKQREEAIDHVLLHGPPGLGKTSLAQVIANEAAVPFYATSGAAIDKKGDLASILTNIEEKGILFIDEIHRLSKVAEEMLYSAMEDRAIDIIIGKGPAARSLKLELNQFTVIGATTRVSMLSAPLRDRFGIDLRLDYYSIDEMQELVIQKARMLNVLIETTAALEIAKRSRLTPRIAVRLLKRVRDYSQYSGSQKISIDLAHKALQMLDVDDNGLDYLDKKIITTLISNFSGGPVGLSTLAAAIAENVETIKEVYEPYLLKEGFISRTPRGRTVTEKGWDYFKKSPK